MHTICQGIWENTSENHMAEQNNNRLLEEKKIIWPIEITKLQFWQANKLKTVNRAQKYLRNNLEKTQKLVMPLSNSKFHHTRRLIWLMDTNRW